MSEATLSIRTRRRGVIAVYVGRMHVDDIPLSFFDTYRDSAPAMLKQSYGVPLRRTDQAIDRLRKLGYLSW